jgi:hypothetical protein
MHFHWGKCYPTCVIDSKVALGTLTLLADNSAYMIEKLHGLPARVTGQQGVLAPPRHPTFGISEIFVCHFISLTNNSYLITVWFLTIYM